MTGVQTCALPIFGAVERATGRETIKKLYLEHQAKDWSGAGFFETSIKALSLELRYDADRLARWPREGPLLVVANHPFGVLDGIILCALIERVRTDFLALTNAVLLRAPEMRARMLPIDLSDTSQAARKNAASRAGALAHLRGGGSMLMFPAGAMATSPDRWGRSPAQDMPWTPFVARLAREARCSIAPVFFHGQNSRLFQIVSHINQNLRLALFFHEVRRRIGTAFPIEIGEVVAFDEFAGLADRAALTAELRRRVLSLSQPRPR